MEEPEANGQDEHTLKEKHHQLAGIVKGVHAKLRKKLHQTGDADRVWKEHCADQHALLEYADAMHHLATEIWTKHPETRIEWCQKTCLEYFFHQDGLRKTLEKEERRKRYKVEKVDDALMFPLSGSPSKDPVQKPAVDMMANSSATAADATDTVSSQSQSIGSPEESRIEEFIMSSQEDQQRDNSTKEDFTATERSGFQNQDSELIFGCPDGMEPTQSGAPSPYNKITLPFQGKIRLLDVGSCFNPFQKFEEFQAVGIDISPAVETVHHCDFLYLDVTDPLQLAPDSFETYIRNLKSPIESLPSQSFHVVVFSLLLEYFPSTYQRWICCQKAQQLLTVNGILVIITPDSHNQNRNAPMIKSWRRAIESLGFCRWRYVKLEHLHCMVFRKTQPKLESSVLVKDVGPDMLYIPQDFNDLPEDDTNPDGGAFLFGSVPYSDEDRCFFHTNFEELPGFLNSL